MAKPIPASGAGAVRIILKNKEDFHFDLREKKEEGNKVSCIYDVFYATSTGTLNMLVVDQEVQRASLNLSVGKVITLENDTNLKKLCNYVISKESE